MALRRLLIDKLLGVTALTACAGCLMLVSKGLSLALAGAMPRRIAGMAVGGLGLGTGSVAFYFGFLLLRYRAERQSTAGEIARDALRRSRPRAGMWRS